VPLQQPFDNQNGNLRVCIRSINYTVGWFNVGPEDAFSWRPSGKTEIMGTIPFPPGLYSFPRLINLFSEIGINFTLRLNRVNCSAKMRVPTGWEVHLTDGLLVQLNFDNDDNGWFAIGTYMSDRPVDLASPKAPYVHLEQLNTTGNFVNRATSTLLTVVEISRNPAFGSTGTVRFETLELKRLSGGFVSELKVTIRDHTGEVMDNNLQPISVVLEIQKEKMKVANAPSAPLYPELSSEPASVFRLHKINEIEAFLHTEVENRERLHEKYRRAVNALEATCGAHGRICIATGAVGAGLLASGVWFVTGLVFE